MTCSISSGNHVFKSCYQCDLNPNDPNQHMDGRGVTYWGYPNGVTFPSIPPQGQLDIRFTPTQPQCYQKPDNCNVYFKAHANSSSGDNVKLWYYTNNPLRPQGSAWGGCWLSGSGNGGWQAVELVNGPDYDESISNIFTIYNSSTTTSVTIENLQIVRVYQMCCLGCDQQQLCNGISTCGTDYTCQAERNTNSTQDFATRIDYPCNMEKCGSRSYTFYRDTEFSGGTIPKNGGCFQWNFNWSQYSQYNYVGSEICLFNFNQVAIAPGQNPNTSDLQLDAYVNGTPFATYHISNEVQGGFAPSFNLKNCSAYNDNGYNEVKLVNNSNYDVVMLDYAINIYRCYRTTPVCQTITVTQTAGGTISPGTSIVPYGGSISFTITANPGYSIAHVYVNGGDIGPKTSPYVYTFNNVTMNQTLSASFGSGHTITASAGAGGSISPAGVTYVVYNGSQNYTITANPGYSILNVYIDGVCYGPMDSYRFGYVTANHTISATFCQQLVLAVYGVDVYPPPYNYWMPVYPRVWVDGNLVGNAPVGVCVSSGYHTVTVDNTAYDPWWGFTAHFVMMGDNHGNYYGNNASILVNSNTNAVAVYNP